MRVVPPLVLADIERLARTTQVRIVRRGFEPSDLDDVWLVVAAATPEVNRQVAEAAEARRIFVNAVDDPDNASAHLSGVVRRDDVTIAISTSGEAPALTSLVREALDAVLPHDLDDWLEAAREETARVAPREDPDGIPQAKVAARAERALRREQSRARPSRHPRGPGWRHDDQPCAMAQRAGGFVAVNGRVSLVGAGPGDPDC